MNDQPIEVRVEGIEDIRRAFDEMLGALGDLTPLMRVVSRLMMQGVRANIESEGARLGTPWPPLRPATIAARKERGQSKIHMLRDTGKLWQAIVSDAGTDYAAVGVGKNIPYAAIHQFGGTIPQRTIKPKMKGGLFWPGAKHPMKRVTIPQTTIPPRPYLALADDDLRRIREAIVKFVNRGGRW